MREILGKAQTVRELLKGVKYSIDYYQREYKWHEKQVRELVEDLTGKLLEEYDPHFVDWLLENVHLVEITAYSDDDAYTIFETMNDRGLSLSPTDMLKGYLLANIGDPAKLSDADTRWRTRIRNLDEAGKETEPDFL